MMQRLMMRRQRSSITCECVCFFGCVCACVCIFCMCTLQFVSSVRLTSLQTLDCLCRYYNIMYDLACAGNPWAQKEYAAMLNRLRKMRKVCVVCVHVCVYCMCMCVYVYPRKSTRSC